MTPRKSSLKSLVESCVRNVAENIDSVWCKQYVEVFKEQGPYKFLIGPFNEIPSSLLNEILLILKKEKKLKRHHLDLIITPQLDALDLSKEQEDVGYPLDLAAARCQKLRTLRLSFCPKIPNRVYQDLLPVFTELQTLNLNGTNCKDSTLFIIGAYLTKLRELDVTGCPVTDEGITGLCAGVDDLNRPSERLGQCLQVVKLCINYTKITDRGIQTALENLAKLRVFECGNSVGVLAKMHLEAWENNLPNRPKYQLRNLSCLELHDGHYETGSLAVAVSLCPDVMKVEIQAHPGLTDADLLSLTSLRNLRELLILGGLDCSLRFDESIAALLQIRGPGLRSLSLAELENVSVPLIVHHCQNLENLELMMNRSYNHYWPAELRLPSRKTSLPGLKKLTLVCSTHLDLSSDVPGDHLAPLLSSQHLRHVFIKECQSLTESLVKEILEANNLSQLEHLEIEQCHEITEEGIEAFLKYCSSLRVLKMWECRQLTRQNAIHWNKMAKKNKWNLTVDWA